MPQRNERVSFRRIRGRIVPIAVKREAAAAKELVSTPQNRASIAKIAAAGVFGLGMATAAGKLFKVSQKLVDIGHVGGVALERASKFLKFGATAIPGLYAGTALLGLDKRTRKDEKANLLNLNSQGNALKHVAALGVGFGFYRLTKRFEVLGKTGKFPIKRLRDL